MPLLSLLNSIPSFLARPSGSNIEEETKPADTISDLVENTGKEILGKVGTYVDKGEEWIKNGVRRLDPFKSKAAQPNPTLIQKSLEGSNVTGVVTDKLGYMRYSIDRGAVALHMPQDISETLEASWEDGEDAIDKILSRTTGTSELFNSGEALTSSSARAAARGAEKVLGVEDLHKSVLRRQGVATNPHSHQFFSGMSFKSHSFKHKLIAFTREDTSLNIEIINYFKTAMKPSFETKSKKYLSYPKVFKIHFMVGANENDFLPKIRECVCTNVEVGYTGSGTWSSFANGAPVDIDLTLQFNELELPYN